MGFGVFDGHNDGHSHGAGQDPETRVHTLWCRLVFRLGVCVCVFVCACVFACECVCVRERERGRFPCHGCKPMHTFMKSRPCGVDYARLLEGVTRSGRATRDAFGFQKLVSCRVNCLLAG